VIYHPIIMSAAAFFAAALVARYAQASQTLALVAAFPYAVFAYTHALIQGRTCHRDWRKRGLEFFIFFFVFLYALGGIGYIAGELFGSVSRSNGRILALFLIGFGLAGVGLGRLNMLPKASMDDVSDLKNES